MNKIAQVFTLAVPCIIADISTSSAFAADCGGGGGVGGGAVAFAGALIDKRYDEAAGATHCTYSAIRTTYTIDYDGFASCPATTPVPRG